MRGVRCALCTAVRLLDARRRLRDAAGRLHFAQLDGNGPCSDVGDVAGVPLGAQRMGGAAAVATIGLILPAHHFTLGDVDNRRRGRAGQFQEFLLIPLADGLVTGLGLINLIPRVRPLALGLWVGAGCAEVAISMLITTLRDRGGGPAPDPVLAGTLCLFRGSEEPGIRPESSGPGSRWGASGEPRRASTEYGCVINLAHAERSARVDPPVSFLGN
jgi:hypothetical protein